MKKYILVLSLFFGICIALGPNIALGAETSYDLQVTFSTNPMIVSPGTNGYLEVNFKNIGSGNVNVYDIDASSWDSSVIQSRGNWNVEIGNIDSGESTSILYEFYVPSSANPGLYQIVFDISSTAGSIRQTAMIKVEDSTALDLTSIKPSSINVGELSTITVNISNSGSTSLYNIEFSWDDANDYILPIGADNIIKIDEILGNNFKEISFDVMVSPTCTAGVYPLIFSLEFYDRTGSQQTITSEVGMQVGGGTDFEIVPQQSTSGTTFAVANTGANTASSVIVTIPQQPGYSTTGSSSVSLGNLDAGDYTLATFQLSSTATDEDTERPAFNRENMPDDFDPNMMGRMKGNFTAGSNLIVEVSYTDLFGIRQTVEKEVEITSFSSSSGSSEMPSRYAGLKNGQGISSESSGIDSGTMYIILGVVGIIAIVGILKIGKSKKILKIIKGKKE
jgi:hypothetical protein